MRQPWQYRAAGYSRWRWYDDRQFARAARLAAAQELAELHGASPADREQLHRDLLHVAWAPHYAQAGCGQLPADALPTELREDLVRELHAKGMTDLGIACFTRMTSYTTARIRARLGLAPNERPATRILSLPRAGSPPADQLPTTARSA